MHVDGVFHFTVFIPFFLSISLSHGLYNNYANSKQMVGTRRASSSNNNNNNTNNGVTIEQMMAMQAQWMDAMVHAIGNL